jgi:hypothetical protein
MSWIETHDGTLVNLAAYSLIQIEQAAVYHANQCRVIATRPGGQVTLSYHDTKEDAEARLRNIGSLLHDDTQVIFR